jgi:hypothetical protein
MPAVADAQPNLGNLQEPTHCVQNFFRELIGSYIVVPVRLLS